MVGHEAIGRDPHVEHLGGCLQEIDKALKVRTVEKSPLPPPAPVPDRHNPYGLAISSTMRAAISAAFPVNSAHCIPSFLSLNTV